MVKFKDNYIGKLAKTKLTDKDEKAHYTKVGNKYIYINYNTQHLLGVCQDVLEFTGLRHNDFAVKVDWYPSRNSPAKHPFPQTQVVKNDKEAVKKITNKKCSTEQVQKKKK